MNKIQTNPLLKIKPPYKMNEIKTLVGKLFSPPLAYLRQRISKWDREELYAWTLGFSLGDASIDRKYLHKKRVELESSRIATILCFIAGLSKFIDAPILIKFYLRNNSFARHKMRATVKVSYHELVELSYKHPNEIENIVADNNLLNPFLAGFMDSDGSIQPYVKFRGKRIKRYYFEPEACLLEQDINLLKMLNVYLGKHYGIRGSVVYGFNGNVYRLRVNSQDSVYRFIKLIKNYLLNIERLPKAKLIEYYLENKIKSLKELRNIYNSLRTSQKYLIRLSKRLIELMVINRLNLLFVNDEIVIVPKN